ncbi:MAG: hypothetical protein QXI42_05950 [Thermoproteota archaeon]|nr:hypothetical protein [Candidatus Brockarchaeota archaeon]
MWPNPSYLFLAAFSAAFAIMMLLYLSPIVETSSVRDLMWLTFLFLMLDAVLSAILAFVKAGSEEKKSK